jgi:hypothetical protein
MTSSVAASFARTAGWRKSLSKTPQDTRKDVVADAAAVRAGMGANEGPK